jgi:hypothetical protein
MFFVYDPETFTRIGVRQGVLVLISTVRGTTSDAQNAGGVFAHLSQTPITNTTMDFDHPHGPDSAQREIPAQPLFSGQ